MTKNINLTNLFCFDNQLTSLDVSQNTKLRTLWCSGNRLSSLDLSQNTVLTKLYCYQNQIKGSGMDAMVKSLPAVNESYLYVIYSENEQNEMTAEQAAAAKAKGWTAYFYDDSNWMEYTSPDGIECLNSNLSLKDSDWYDLSGRRLSKPQRGLNIIGGKKITIK